MQAADQTSTVLTGGRTREVRAKRELIVDLCRGKEVLDLGAVQHSWRMSVENPEWLHAAIRAVAERCVGVDFLADDVAELSSRGYDMVAADVLRDDPPGQFDVVVAGDLIEHLQNPGILLEYAARALKPGGIVVITTPNALYAAQFTSILLRGRPGISPEHVVLFDPFTFGKLVERSPLRVRELHWLEPSWWALWDSPRLIVRLLGRPLHWLTRGLLQARPYFNSDFAAVLELRPPGDAAFDPRDSAEQVMQHLHMAP